MARKAKPPVAAPVQRTFTETYPPDGNRVYEYTSETHTIRVTAAGEVDKQYTSFLLRKLADWLSLTPPPPRPNGDAWAGSDDEPPF